MLFLLLLSLLIVPPLYIQTQDIPVCDQQVTDESLLEQLTFDDAVYLLTYMRFCELHTKKDMDIKWSILMETISNESDVVCRRNNVDLKSGSGSAFAAKRFWI